LNQQLQGNDKLVSDLYKKIAAFQRKLQLFTAQLRDNNLCHYPVRKQMSEQQQGVDYTQYAGYMHQLLDEFSGRFRDFRAKKELYSVFSDPPGADTQLTGRNAAKSYQNSEQC